MNLILNILYSSLKNLLIKFSSKILYYSTYIKINYLQNTIVFFKSVNNKRGYYYLLFISLKGVFFLCKTNLSQFRRQCTIKTNVIIF